MTKSDESLLIHGFGSWLRLFPIGFHPVRNTACWLLGALQECARSCFQGFIQNPAGSAVPGVLPTLLLNTSALEAAKGYVPSGLCARVPHFGFFVSVTPGVSSGSFIRIDHLFCRSGVGQVAAEWILGRRRVLRLGLTACAWARVVSCDPCRFQC